MPDIKKNSRGRPVSFSRDDLVKTVTEMFWQDGYKSISLNKVAQEMGLSRTSLYNSFKTKEALFLECLNHYAEQSPTQKLQQYQSGQNAGELLHNVLYGICAERSKDPQNRGCLATNVFHELANDKTPLGKILLESSEAKKENMTSIINHAVMQKELPENTNITSTAYIILSFMNGLNAHAKSGATETEMQDMCDLFLSSMGFTSIT